MLIETCKFAADFVAGGKHHRPSVEGIVHGIAPTVGKQAETGLAGVLSRLMAVAERYPDLKADGQMSRVSEELASTENRIAFARQHYNDEVTAYNVKREVFPSSLVAGFFNFAPAALLESTQSETERTAPQVKF